MISQPGLVWNHFTRVQINLIGKIHRKQEFLGHFDFVWSCNWMAAPWIQTNSKFIALSRLTCGVRKFFWVNFPLRYVRSVNIVKKCSCAKDRQCKTERRYWYSPPLEYKTGHYTENFSPIICSNNPFNGLVKISLGNKTNFD